MKKLDQIVDNLADTLNVLIDKYQQLKQEISELRSYNNLLKQQITEKENKIVELNDLLKRQNVLSNHMANNSERENLKLLVKQTVKEVDNCLQLLNNN